MTRPQLVFIPIEDWEAEYAKAKAASEAGFYDALALMERLWLSGGSITPTQGEQQ